MRLRMVLIGIIGLILVTFAVTTILFSLVSKQNKKQQKALIILMSILGLAGLGGFLYSGNIYWQMKFNKEKAPTHSVAVIDGKEVSTLANAKERLVLPMAYDTIEATHPSVYNFPEKWHGYKYWMAVTAYPKGEADKENPHILGSNDMIQWEPANGYENPLDEPVSEGLDKFDRPLQYNSDTHIIYNKEKDRLELFWRYVDDVNDEVKIFRSESTDGTNWSDKHSIYTAPRKKADWVSPAFIKDDEGYKVWYVANGYRIWYRESKDGENWTEAKEVKVPYATDKDRMHHWHLDVQKFGDKYEMIVVGFKQMGEKPNIGERHVMNLYHSTSKDGFEWSDLTPIIYPSQIKDAWDGRGIYRSCFIKEDGKYYVFYSGIGSDDTRGVGLSYGEDIHTLKGIDYSDTHDLD